MPQKTNFNVKVFKNVYNFSNEKVLISNDSIFEKLDKEITWLDDVTHRGGPLPRLFALQATIVDNNIPLYRHPIDSYIEPIQFTPLVDNIRKELENKLSIEYGRVITLNHAILQKYRDGKDVIGEHSDKTIDIMKDSLIVNYSAGESRIMTFRSKLPINNGGNVYDIHKIDLMDNSAVVLDLNTNKYYKHEIKSNAQITKPRISITFRHIGTFINNDVIFGQGSPLKTLETIDILETIVPKNSLTSQELLHTWSNENRGIYDWDDLYSRGFLEKNI